MIFDNLMIILRLMVYAREGVLFHDVAPGLANSSCGRLIEWASRMQDNLLMDEFIHNPKIERFATNKTEFIEANRIQFIDIASMSPEMRNYSIALKKRTVILIGDSATNISYIPEELLAMASPASPIIVYKLNCPPDGHEPPSCEELINDQSLNRYGQLPDIEILDVCTIKGSQKQQLNLIKANTITTTLTIANDTQTGQMQINVTMGHGDDQENETGRSFGFRKHNSNSCTFRCYEGDLYTSGEKLSMSIDFKSNEFFQLKANRCLRCIQAVAANDKEHQPKGIQIGPPDEQNNGFLNWVVYLLPLAILLLYMISFKFKCAPSACSLRLSRHNIWSTIFALSYVMRHLQTRTQLINKTLGSRDDQRQICLVELAFYTNQKILLISIALNRFTNWIMSVLFQIIGVIFMSAFRGVRGYSKIDDDKPKQCINQEDDNVIWVLILIIVLITFFYSWRLICYDLLSHLSVFSWTPTTSDTYSTANIIKCLLVDVLTIGSFKYTYESQQKWTDYLKNPEDHHLSLIPLMLTILRSVEFNSPADVDEI